MKIQFNDTFKLGEPEKTYLWLVDIVGYSKISDLNAQEILIKNIFNCVYASVNEVATIIREDKFLGRELTSDDATVIWTGDGAIVATKHPFGINTPLLLSSFFVKYWENEDNWSFFRNSLNRKDIPKVHIATHYGNCRWLQTPTLRSPLFEISNCFGVDINLLARIATFSTEQGEYIISEEYFAEFEKSSGDYKLEKGNGDIQYIGFTENKSGSVAGKGAINFNYREFYFIKK